MSERHYERRETASSPYTQKRGDMEHRKGYHKERDITEEYIFNILGITFGVAAIKEMYEKGHMRPFISRYVHRLINDEHLEFYSYAVDEMKKITSNTQSSLISDIIDISTSDLTEKAYERALADKANREIATLNNLEVIRLMRERQHTLHLMTRASTDSAIIETLEHIMAKDLIKHMSLDAKLEAEFMEKTGVRHATVRDILEQGRFDSHSLVTLNLFKRHYPGSLNMMVDSAVLIDEHGSIMDFRGQKNALKKMARSMTSDFAIPILGINPVKMFRLDKLLGYDDVTTPLFNFIPFYSKQPILTGHTDEIKFNHVFTDGKIYNLSTGELEADNQSLIRIDDVRARDIQNMSGTNYAKFKPRHDNPLSQGVFNIMKYTDIGFQGNQYRQKIDWMHPGTTLEWLTSTFQEHLSPVVRTSYSTVEDAFGKGTEWIAINNTIPLGEKGGLTQLVAGSHDLRSITKATTIPYMLVERMNRGLHPFYLGLSEKSLGSAPKTFAGLFNKRVLPVVLGISALAYADYLLENKETGISPKDKIVEKMANASTNVAGMRDKLGINERMARFKELSPGINFIEEMPIIGNLFDSRTKEEVEDYWEDGSDPIRKGRFWTLGNTPYTGSRIEYYRPNVKRRVESDYKYTDSLYGSKEEYWKHNWLPTPTSPFAPIRHFITDPYHWERKHYEDRPYLMTGGIAELNEIPLIGGFLNATIGRILKPPKKMHEEYWDGNKVKTAMEVEYTPYQDVSQPPQTLRGETGAATLKPRDTLDHEQVVYSTSSGQTSLYAVRDDLPLDLINQKLKSFSIKRVDGATRVMDGSNAYGKDYVESVKVFNPNGLGGAVENMITDATDLGGFYGFSVGAVAGLGEVDRPRLATADPLTSYSRTFWDQSLGGFGGELSEIFRRFAPNKSFKTKQNEINPIRNRMPTWLPGPEYYTNYLHGDPYTKIKEGEYRLPGEGYEAMHRLDNPMNLQIGSSSFGKDYNDLIKHFLHVDDIEIAENEALKAIMQKGTKAHESIQNVWQQIGQSVETEYYVKNEERHVEGWIDAIIKDKTSHTGYAVADIKTINDRGYNEVLRTGKVRDSYKAQIQFYMEQTGHHKGYLHFVNRDNKDAKPITMAMHYDKDYLESAYANLDKARSTIRQGIEQGIIQRGDLYKPLERFKILADVAPYSDKFTYYNRLMTKISLRDHEKEEVKAIRERVSNTKEKMRLTPYKFETAELDYHKVTINKVLDNGLILTEEFKDNPLKLAGVDFSTSKSSQEGIDAMTFLRRRLRPGSSVRIGVNADALRRVNQDTYSTMDAVIDSDNRKNLNRYMIDEGLGEENDDTSATGIHARYGRLEIAYGKLFEDMSHADTFFNTKFLQARSALEEYERKDLYGKQWQDWKSPISDFLIPTVQNIIRKDVLTATTLGAAIGATFGASRNKYGKIMGGGVGGILAFAGSMITQTSELITGDSYIPKRRQKEFELNEYFDKLKYIKSMKLFDTYREEAITREGVDPIHIIQQNKKEGDERKRRIRELETIKQKLMTEQLTIDDANKQLNATHESLDNLNSAINKEITTLQNFREVSAVTPYAARALDAYHSSKQTAYGYEAGDPIQNIMAAFTRKDKKYFMPFLEAPEREREQILKVAPTYMKRALQSAYRKPVDERKDLEDYFTKHYLPDDEWIGWRQDVDLEDVKIKMVRHEGMDYSDFDIWDDDIERTDRLDLPLPKINYKERASTVRHKLREVLQHAGLEDISLDVSASQTPGIDIQFAIEKDRKKEIEDYISSNGIF